MLRIFLRQLSMFRILVVDKRDSIHSAIKYLLYRYDLIFSYNIKDAVNKMNENNIDMVLLNLSLENTTDKDWDILKECASKRKTIILMDSADPDLMGESYKFGALEYIDKLDIAGLPELVTKHLNKSDTKILN